MELRASVAAPYPIYTPARRRRCACFPFMLLMLAAPLLSTFDDGPFFVHHELVICAALVYTCTLASCTCWESAIYMDERLNLLQVYKP